MNYRISHSDAQYNKIQCIKGIRAVTGVGLKGAKDWVEEMMDKGYMYLECRVQDAQMLQRDYGFTLGNTEPLVPKELFEFEGSNRFTYGEDEMVYANGDIVAWQMPNKVGLFFQSEDGTWKAITYSDFKLVREILAVMG